MQKFIKLYSTEGIYMEYINLKEDIIKIAVEGDLISILNFRRDVYNKI